MIAERFERDCGCTEAEWLRWLPLAVGEHPLRMQPGGGAARVDIGTGRLELRWTVLPPRRIARLQLPRLAVHFAFEGVPPEAREPFMRHFDLHLQRGGG